MVIAVVATLDVVGVVVVQEEKEKRRAGREQQARAAHGTSYPSAA
jgi:hypothetical protein